MANNAMDLLKIYDVTIYIKEGRSPDVELEFLNNYINGYMLRITECEDHYFTNNAGNNVHSQSISVLADAAGINSIQHYCKTRFCFTYTPSDQKGNKTHTLFLPMHVLYDNLSQFNVDKARNIVHDELAKMLFVLVKNKLLGNADFKIVVRINPQKKNAYVFINFNEENVTPWEVGRIKVFLTKQYWDMNPNVPVEVRIQNK